MPVKKNPQFAPKRMKKQFNRTGLGENAGAVQDTQKAMGDLKVLLTQRREIRAQQRDLARRKKRLERMRDAQ